MPAQKAPTSRAKSPSPKPQEPGPSPASQPAGASPMVPPPTPSSGPPTAAPVDPNTWAMLTHLSAFAMFLSIPLGNILGPLVFWQIKKSIPFVDHQGKEAVNFQISMTIYGLVLGLVGFLLILGGILGGAATLNPAALFVGFFAFFPLLLAVAALLIFTIVNIIMASLRAQKGIAYRYPLSIRFVR